MQTRKPFALGIALLCLALLLPSGAGALPAAAAGARADPGVGVPTSARPADKPRLLVLPWVVIDRTTNRDCSKLGSSQAPARAEALRLAGSAQAALDAAMHRHGMMEMIPRKEWEPHWRELPPGRVVWQGPGCAVCTPVGELLHDDRAALQALAQAVRADYVWLGVTVVPLTKQNQDNRPDDCCREALAQERKAVLARSSVLLVRASDGEIVWQRDARRLERDVPHRVGRLVRTAAARREIAVKDTAHLLGNAFSREHREALR
jgi:hypothetical protein